MNLRPTPDALQERMANKATGWMKNIGNKAGCSSSDFGTGVDTELQNGTERLMNQLVDQYMSVKCLKSSVAEVNCDCRGRAYAFKVAREVMANNWRENEWPDEYRPLKMIQFCGQNDLSPKLNSLPTFAMCSKYEHSWKGAWWKCEDTAYKVEILVWKSEVQH